MKVGEFLSAVDLPTFVNLKGFYIMLSYMTWSNNLRVRKKANVHQRKISDNYSFCLLKV